MSQRYEQRPEGSDQEGAAVEELRWPGKKTKVGAAMKGASDGAPASESDPRRPDIARIRAAVGGLTSGGEKLDAGTAGKFGGQLGVDLSGVTLHKDNTAAAELGASAFTHGDHVAIAPGVDLASGGGQHVLAHELVHVAQNMSAGGSAMEFAARMDVGPSSSPAEAQAEAGAGALLAGQGFSAGGIGALPGISMFEGPPPASSPSEPAPTGTPAAAEQIPATDPRSPDYDPSKDPAVLAQLAQVPTVNTQQQATPPPVPAPKPAPAPPVTPGPAKPPVAPTVAPASPQRPTIGPAPAPKAPKSSPTVNLDELVKQTLEQRADPQAKQSYSNATNQIDILRIQAVQYAFQPTGLGTNILAGLWPWEAWKQHGREISLTNPYDAGSLQAWIEGARGTIRILGDVAAWVATIADIVAAVSGLLAIISSWTGAGLVIFGAIAAIAAEVGTIAGLIKIILDIIDVVIGVVQMILTIKKIKASKDPAERAKLGALLGREVKEVSGAVVGIGVQVVTIVATAGLAAGVTGMLQKSTKGFWKNFGSELFKEFRPILAPKQSIAAIRDAAKLGVRAPKQALREGVDPKQITQKEIADGAVTVERIERRRELVKTKLSRSQRKKRGKLREFRDVVTKSQRPVLGPKDLKVPKSSPGKNGTKREVRFIVDPNKLKTGIPKAEIETFSVDASAIIPGQTAGQVQARAKKTGDASAPPEQTAKLPGTQGDAGTSPLTQVAMWPSQLETLKATKAELPAANDRLGTMYNLAKGQAGAYQSGQFEKVFAGVKNAAGQMRLGALQQQTDATEGATQSEKGATTAGQGKQQTTTLGGKTAAMDQSTQKMGAQKVEKPPPKEGGSWWDKAKNWLYNQTIGRIGDAIGGLQSWLTKSIGGWVMAQSGLTKEELDMAGIENSMRADHQKDKQTEAEMKAAQEEANKIDPKLAEIMKGANADEQAALQAMMESQEFITSIDEAQKALDEAIAAGTAYITEVSPIIRHEMETQTGGKAIDEAYVAPVVGGANALKGSVGGGAELGAAAAADVIAELTEAQTWWPELNLAPSVAGVNEAKQAFVGSHDQLANGVKTAADGVISRVQGLVGSQDYAGVHDAAKSLDSAMDRYSTDEDALVEVYLRNLERVLDATADLIQSAVTQQEVDVPSDEAPTDVPVQRKATGGPVNDNADPGAIAAAGTQGPGGRLPHFDRIQQSFGRHDVSGVQAHVGGDAAAAAGGLGAKAFATGNKVAFADSPDLHTAAHEAAHVVQQRSGVSLKAIDGGASDPHEQHADKVADAVVAGQSAEGLLDKPSAEAPAAAKADAPVGRAVQRKQADAPQPQEGDKEENKDKADPSVAAPKAPSGEPDVADEAKQAPKAKGDKLDVKGDKKGDAEAKPDAKEGKDKAAKKDGPAAKDPKAAAADGAQPPPGAAKAPAAVQPVAPPDVAQAVAVAPVQPLRLADAASNPKLDDKWIKDTGRTPAAHHAQIQSDLDALTAEIQAKQTELMTLADTESTRIGNEMAGKVAGFAAAVIAPGRGRVDAAFGGMSKSLDLAEQKAKGEIAASKTQGAAQIAAGKAQKGAELTNKFTTAKASNQAHFAKNVPIAVGAINKFVATLPPIIEKTKQTASTLQTTLTAAKEFDPTQFSARGGLEGGLGSARAEIGKNLIVSKTNAMSKNFDEKLTGFGKDVEKKAQSIVEGALKPAKIELDAAVDVVEGQTKKSLDAAEATAKTQLETTEQASLKAVADTKTASQQKWTTEKAGAIEAADKAGKALSDNTTAATTELTSRIKKRASEDAGNYGALAADVQSGLRSGKPQKYEDVAPKIADAKQRLAAGHAQNMEGLRALATTGGTELGATLTKQQGLYDQAIKTQEDQAKLVEQKLTQDVGQSATGMTGSLGELTKGFDDASTKQNAALDAAVNEFNATANGAFADYDKKVTAMLSETITQLDAELKKELDPKKVTDEARAAAAKEIKAKQKSAVAGSGAMRKAMDGWGTDENAIYEVLRKCSWGEIELLEATYDNHYDNRGKNGMTPLRYDLWDEMSKGELAIAMAYLNHDRKTAIKLELDDAQGLLWNDNKRIESVLRSASDEEIKFLNSDPGAKATITSIKGAFWTSDKDVFNTLLDQSMSKEDRATKANAIRLFAAMDGWGTNEAEVKRLLLEAATPEERKRLRAQFNQYAAAKKSSWATDKTDRREGDDKEKDDNGNVIASDVDALDRALTDDFGSGEVHYVRELAKEKRDDTAVNMGKIVEAADGMGTDEDALFDALEDKEYAAKWKAAKAANNTKLMAELEAERKEKLNKLLGRMGHKKGVDNLINEEMDQARLVTEYDSEGMPKSTVAISYDELLAGKRADGTPVTDSDKRQLRGGFGLEGMVAQRKLKTGQAEPELLLAYACWGVAGTHEELINKTLSDGGEPLPLATVKGIAADFARVWGTPLVTTWEIDTPQHNVPDDQMKFPDPGGELSRELGGKDWLKTRLLLCGKPETAPQLRYVQKLQVNYAKSGVLSAPLMWVGEATGYTSAGSDQANSEKKFDAKYAKIADQLGGKITTESLANIGKVKNEKGEVETATNADGSKQATGDELELLGEYLQQDTEAYAAALASIVDTIVMVVEIVGAIILTVVTAGTAAPVLAAVLGNLIIAAGTITFKYAALGAQYGAEDLAKDVIQAAVTAGFAGLGEVKALADVTAKAGQKATGALFKVVGEAAEQGGAKVVTHGSGHGFQISEKAFHKISSAVGEGTKNVIIGSGQELASALTDEKTYEMKLGEALWGENSIGARLIKNAPRAFAEGAVRQFVNEGLGVSNQNNTGGLKTPLGNMMASMLSDAGANVAGFFLYLDNYNDAQSFWDELLKSTGKKAASGFFQGYGMHKARAKRTGRDFLLDRATPEQLAAHLAFLDPREVHELASFVKKYGTQEQFDKLPDAYKRTVGADPAAPTAAATTPKATKPSVPDVADGGGGDDTATKKQDGPDAAAAKIKADADAAEAAKVKADADAAERKRIADAEAAKAKPAEEPKAKPVVADGEEEAKPKPAEEAKPKPVVADEKPAAKPVAAATDEDATAPKVPTPAEEEHARPGVGSHKGKDVFTSDTDGKTPAKTTKDQLQTALVDVTSGRKVVVNTVTDGTATIEITVQTPNGPIKVPATVRVADTLPASSHGDDGGAARFTLDHVDGKWVAHIDVQQGLHPNDIKFVVGHEVDEISTLVGKHPAGKPAGGLNEQTKAGVLGGGTDKATAHDQAGAREIVDLYNDYKRLLSEGSPEAARRKATLDRALEAQGLTDTQHLEAKRKLLTDAGATDDLLTHVTTTAKPKAVVVDDDGTAPKKPADQTPSAETLELAKKAFEVYAGEIDGAKDILKQIGGEFGDVQGRPKDPESAANRLQRAITNKWAKDGITTVQQAVDNTWDALGTRLVIHDMTNMPKVVQALKDAIESGQIQVTAINNLHAATDGKPYMSAAEITSIAASANEHAKPGPDGKKPQIKSDVGKPMDGGFTGVMIYVQYPSGVRGEIQIIGKHALAVAAVEHIPYDIGLGKPIVRNVHPDVEPQMRKVLGPIEDAVKAVNADPVKKAEYEKYLAALYKHARDMENGVDSPPPKLPDGIDKHLSMDGLQKVQQDLEDLKKQSKALQDEEAKKPVTGSAKGAAVYDTADGGAPRLKLDADSAKEVVALHAEIKRLEAAKDPQAEVKKQELARRLADLHGDNLEAHRKLLADAKAPDDLLEQLTRPVATVRPEDVTAKPTPVTTNEAETTTGDATTTKPSAMKPAVTDAEKKSATELADSVDGLRQTFGDQIAAKNAKLVGPPTDRPVIQQGAGDALIGLPLKTIAPTDDGPTALAKLQKDGIPRWGALTENERKHETAFAHAIESSLPEIVASYYARSRDDKMGAHVFEVDGAKKLYAAYGMGKAPDGPDQTQVRATANHALHPAAVAIARIAFLQHLDYLKSLPPDHPQRDVLVTNGGCAAGKGSLTGIVKGANEGKFKFGGVWDAAGEGDASENGWILRAAQARGLKVTFGFVESDPTVTYNGVLDRAESTGRIVDPVTFTRSYVKGQENMRAFLESPEYQAALARGDVETAGVYTGKFDKESMSFPNQRLLGDKGKIGADDLNTPPSETEISKRAVEIFETWLKQQQAAGKPTDHWVEGGIVNPLKFDPNNGAASDGAAPKPRTEVADSADPKTVKPNDDTKIKPDDPALKPKEQPDVPPVDAASPSTKGKVATADKTEDDDTATTGSHKGKDVFRPRTEMVGDTAQVKKLSQAELQQGLAPLAARKNATVEVTNVTDTEATLNISVRPKEGGDPVVLQVKVNLLDQLAPSAHGEEGGGSGRFTIDHDGTTWKASISIAQGIDPRDLRFVVGHEIDEIADIVQKHPAGKPKDGFDAETKAGVTRDNGQGKKIRSHDVAAALEIVDLYNDWKRLEAAGDPDAAYRKETLDRAIAANNFKTIGERKLDLLRQVDAPAEMIQFLQQGAANATGKVKAPAKVEPGIIPPDLDAKQQKIYAEANEIYANVTKDGYLGKELALVQWAKYLKEHGITVSVETISVTDLGPRPTARTASDDLLNKGPKHADHTPIPGGTVPMDPGVGKRPATLLSGVKNEVALAAFQAVCGNAKGFEVESQGGQSAVVLIPSADGKGTIRVRVKMRQPTHIEDGGMGGMLHDSDEIHIWVSSALPDDQVQRAMGAILAHAVATKQRGSVPTNEDATRVAVVGQLDALIGQFKDVAKANETPIEPLPANGTNKDRAEVAARNATRKNEDRIGAEIELLLAQHDAHQPGAAQETLLKQMSPKLQDELRAFLAARKNLIGFNADAQRSKDQLPAAPTDEATDRPSTVLARSPRPDDIRPYSEADRVTVIQLKVVFETIKEIDGRLAQRDQKNTGDREHPIAAGETMRRKELVMQAQDLLAKLQLGGTDPAYYAKRLEELEAVFPGVKDAVSPQVNKRVAERVESDEAHAEVVRYRAKAQEESEKLEKQLRDSMAKPDEPFCTDRVVVGDGPTGLANVAGLGIEPATPDGFVDPTKLLVVGGPDLIARMADANPNMKWGQRAEVFDGGGEKHPIFRGGQGELQRTAEDPGDFATVGQVTEAMDLARQRMGVTRANATVLRVELKASTPDGWKAEGYPVRVVMMVGGKEVVVYTKHTDITTGLGTNKLPDESVMSSKDRKRLTEGKDPVFKSGEDVIVGGPMDGKKVLVLGFGPTGAWASIEAARRGAKNVDWGGSSGQLDDAHKSSNNSLFGKLRDVDRVSETLDPRSRVNVTTDRILKIEPQGDGATVTYALGKPPNVTTYQVFYDKVIAAALPVPAKDASNVPAAEPNAGTIVDGIKFGPQKGTEAPVWASEGGEVRVMGPAAEGVTGSGDGDADTMKNRRNQLPKSADSPDHRVMEATGTAVDWSNGIGGPGVPAPDGGTKKP